MAGITVFTKEVLTSGNAAAELIKGWSQSSSSNPTSTEFKAGAVGFVGAMLSLADKLFNAPAVKVVLGAAAPPLAMLGFKYSVDEAKNAYTAYTAAVGSCLQGQVSHFPK